MKLAAVWRESRREKAEGCQEVGSAKGLHAEYWKKRGLRDNIFVPTLTSASHM